jgi:uncharacterized membrane protein YoaK (UPF0700 family)
MKLAALVLSAATLAAQSTPDEVLTDSQIFLAGAAGAETEARFIRYPAQGRTGTLTAVAAVGLTITLERVTKRKLGRKAKFALAIANIAGGAVLVGFAHANAVERRGVP